MSIELTTDCKDCMHNAVCKYEGNALSAMEKLKNAFDGGCKWEDSMKNKHVDITFSCPDFISKPMIVNTRLYTTETHGVEE